MSGVNPNIDLEGLARDASRVPAPRGRWKRFVVPLAILGGFGVVLVLSLGDLFSDPVEVTVVRPRAVEGAALPAGTVVLQAAGWVEPDPFPIQVTSLAEGVVQKMMVEESDTVKAGQPVAELVSDKAILALAGAEAALDEARAALEVSRVEMDYAREIYDESVALTERHEVAVAELKGRRASALKRAAAVVEADAKLRVAREELKTQVFLQEEGAAGPWQVELAQAQVDVSQGTLSRLQAESAEAAAAVEIASAKLKRVKRDLELRLEDNLLRQTAMAHVPRLEATVKAAEVARDEAALRLSRMVVRAPADGVVLVRKAAPGSVVGAHVTDGAVCSLYDPSRLRIRVDVPQGDVGSLGVGQKAFIETDTRPGKPYNGEVLRIVHRADIQKVTLEVQVRVLDADPLIRPDVLSQVRFLAPETTAANSEPGKRSSVFLVPARVISGEGRAWVIDGRSGRAVMRRVETGRRIGDDIEIRSGLNASDKVIDRGRDGLSEGDRVTVVRGG